MRTIVMLAVLAFVIGLSGCASMAGMGKSIPNSSVTHTRSSQAATFAIDTRQEQEALETAPPLVTTDSWVVNGTKVFFTSYPPIGQCRKFTVNIAGQSRTGYARRVSVGRWVEAGGCESQPVARAIVHRKNVAHDRQQPTTSANSNDRTYAVGDDREGRQVPTQRAAEQYHAEQQHRSKKPAPQASPGSYFSPW